MTQQQIALLRQSIAPLQAHPARGGDLFFQILFTFDPSLRSLFPADLTGQGKKLVNTLAALIIALQEGDTAALTAFARRHALFFQPPCHNVLREALLWTLAQLLGPRFHDDVAAAWCQAYNTVAARLKSSLPNPS